MNNGIKLNLTLKKKRDRPYKNLRATINGIIWILKTGAMWRDLPSLYGDWNAVYKCFSKWQAQGIFEKILKELAIEADFQDVSIDSTIVKVHQDSVSKKKELIGKSRGGNTTKIHALPVKIEISAGQVSDHIFAPKLIKDLNLQIVIMACIPRHRNRKAKFPFDKVQRTPFS